MIFLSISVPYPRYGVVLSSSLPHACLIHASLVYIISGDAVPTDIFGNHSQDAGV